MSTLAEIEAAADSLSSAEKEELLRFLAMRLRKERALPNPRIYSEEELASMLAEDEADGERFARYPLRGTPVMLLDPTEPVADADWEAAG